MHQDSTTVGICSLNGVTALSQSSNEAPSMLPACCQHVGIAFKLKPLAVTLAPIKAVQKWGGLVLD